MPATIHNLAAASARQQGRERAPGASVPSIHDLADLSEAEIERRLQQGVPPIPARHMREIEMCGLRMVETPLDAFADDSECVEDMLGSWSHEPIRREEHYNPLSKLLMLAVWLVVCGYALKLAVVG